MENQELAKIFYHISIYLTIANVPFKPQAYEKAALSLEALKEEVRDIYKKEGEEGLRKIPAIGAGITEKIVEYLKTGKIKDYEKMRRQMPVQIEELIKVEGIGPKIIRDLYKHLKITSLRELEKAARERKIRKLFNFGEKTEKNILEGIAFLNRSKGRFLLDEAYFLAEEIINQLKKIREIEEISAAGSLRRMKDSIGDIDLLAYIEKDKQEVKKRVMNAFTNLKGIVKIWNKGITKSSVRFDSGIDVDLRLVKKREFGSALQYFTGSKEHNIVVRKIALIKGLKLNEYGVFKKIKNERKRVAGKNEEEVYKMIGLPYIEPELRENAGEVEAALKNKLPKIIGYNDIKGDLHCHSDWDGGDNSIEEMAKAARLMGYEYIGITDHTKFLRIERGLDEKQLLSQHKEIQKLNSKFQILNSKFQILHGCEANILEDGRLDIDDEVLRQLDYVIAGIHSQMKMHKKEMTERIIRAMKNPNVDIISHLTGRLINKREECEIDFDKILSAAKKTNTTLEINAFPQRLDLKDSDVRKTVSKGVKLVINSDAHSENQLSFMKFGIAQARRGWATKNDIINTWSLNKLKEFFEKRI